MSQIPASSAADSPVHFSASSRYKDTKIIMRRPQNVRELALWTADRSFSTAPSYTRHQITDSDIGRLDLLSYFYYGTPDYWWIIADANDMIHPLRDMVVGEFIKIPDRNIIDAFVRRKPVKP